MEVKASLDKYRSSDKKIRGVIRILKGLGVEEARLQLENLSKGYAGDLKNLLLSAIANAKNNYNLKEEGLVVKDIIVQAKPTMKRWRPRAFGRAAQILKRTIRLEIILEETAEAKKIRESGDKKRVKETRESIKAKSVNTVKAEEKKINRRPEKKIGEIKDVKKLGKAPSFGGKIRKVFQRKSF